MKQEIEHDEFYEDTWEVTEDEWLPYKKSDVLSTAFCYARFSIGMQEVTAFGKRNSLTLPSLANKNFNSSRDEDNEPIQTYTNAFLKNFVRNSIKGGRCNSFIQHFNSEISDEVFNNISKELNVNGNIYDLLEKYFEFLSKYENLYAKEHDSEYEDYRDINQREKIEYFNNEFNMLPVHEQLSQLDLNNTQMD